MTDGISKAADLAITNAMYRYTFGIVGNSKDGAEGKGLGTGVGIFWKGTYLILTAEHVMSNTPSEKLYILLPHESVWFEGADVQAEPVQIKLHKRLQRENAKQIHADEDDLAALVLPSQGTEVRHHFYRLDEAHPSSDVGDRQIGIAGYPGATAVPVGGNLMATPYSSYGKVVSPPQGVDTSKQLAISFPLDQSVDPHGLSGGGLWNVSDSVDGQLWTANVTLTGIIKDWYPDSQVLIGYRVERLIEFLKLNAAWMTEA